jgi:hypothetical protein
VSLVIAPLHGLAHLMPRIRPSQAALIADRQSEEQYLPIKKARKADRRIPPAWDIAQAKHVKQQ